MFLAALMLTTCTAMTAQTSTVRGLLADSLTLEGEPFATVRVYKDKNLKEPIAMSVSQADGKFQQKVDGRGEFTMTFNSVGRKEVSRKVSLDGKNDVDLGTIYLQDDARQLEGVEVTAQKPLVKMETDKMSYSVQDDADSKSSTVLDMLRKVPMVTVDAQDNITVNGSSSFKVFVNGKPNMMFQSNSSQIFKAMPASLVKNIEVITNPGAQFDAEGTGGVLNIVMAGAPGQEASVNGLNGSLRLTGGNKQQGGSLFLSGQQNKFSFSLNAMTNYGKTKNTEVELMREQYGANGTSMMDYRQRSTTRMPFSMASISMGYELDSMSTLSATAGVRSFTMKNTGDPHTRMHGGLYGRGFSYDQWMRYDNKRVSVDASVDYQRFLNREKTSSITLIYQFGLNPTTDDNWTTYGDIEIAAAEGGESDPDSPLPAGDASAVPDYLSFDDRHSHSKEKSTEHVVQADYTTPLAQNHKLNAGLKLTLRDNSSDSRYYTGLNGEWTYAPLLSMDYSHQNEILAGYAEYEGKFGKIGTKAGLRYEHTWQDVEFRLGNGEDFRKDYGNFVPSANVSYQLAPTANLGLTYNLRISRPGISYLNPYVDRSSNTALSYGNPDLDVEKTHNLGLVFNFYSPKIMGNLNFRQSFTNNGISQYSFYEDGLLNTTYGNIVRQRNTSLSLWMSWMLSQKTRFFLNGGFSYVDLRSHELEAHNSGWQGNAMMGLQQTLPGDLKLGAFLITNSKTHSLQGWNSGFNMLAGSLTKSFLNDKLSIGIQGQTGLQKGGKLHFDSYTHGNDFSNRQTIHVPIGSLAVNLTWNFGNQKVKAKTKTTQVESDVMEKQNGMEQMNQMNMP